MKPRGQTRRRIFTVLAVLWLAVIWIHSVMPADLSRQESGGLLELLLNVFPWLTDHILRKLAHFTEYAIFGVLVFGAAFGGRHSDALPPLIGVIAAMVDETIQLFSDGRSGQVTDVWIDFSGFLLCWGVLRLIGYLIEKKKQTETESA